MTKDLSRSFAFTVHLAGFKIQTWAKDADTAVSIVLENEHAPCSALEGVYQDNPVPHVSAKYGAPLGRNSDPLDHDGNWQAKHVKLDEGGYDNGGAYWGLRPTGVSLFAVQDGVGNIAFVDAPNKTQALEAAAA